uniref:Uncharacterized protein n=1 Tax=Anguilla anguilla TaxID=7936 RepID=A0A0E9SFV0_ANGAN
MRDKSFCELAVLFCVHNAKNKG